jgi:hypothetical protein
MVARIAEIQPQKEQGTRPCCGDKRVVLLEDFQRVIPVRKIA